MRAFHDDVAIKQMLLGRCVTSRNARRFRQGGCHDEGDMQIGCATAVMLQTRHPRLVDFEELFGLSYSFARIAEMIFEALPYEGAILFPEYAIAAIPIGADTRSIGWQLLQRTLADHEGAQHRINAATVNDTLAFLTPLTAGATVDLIDAREKMMAAGRTLKVAYEAVGGQEHPVWDAALIAQKALAAAATTCSTEASNEVMRAIKITAGTPAGAVAAAQRMIALLEGCETSMERAGQLRLLEHVCELGTQDGSPSLANQPGERAGSRNLPGTRRRQKRT